MPASSADAATSEPGEGGPPTGRGPAEREPPQRRSAKSVRLFFALWPTPAMQSALADASAHAVSEARNGGASADASAHATAEARPSVVTSVRPIPAANFHLTLAFLGSIPLNRLPDVELVAARFVRASSLRELPIKIVLDSIEHWRKAQVLVATASNTPTDAVALAEGLQRSLVDAGFTPDLKPFRAHATIARKVRRVGGELQLQPVRWSFDSLHLVESQTRPDGSAYRTLKKWVLDKRD